MGDLDRPLGTFESLANRDVPLALRAAWSITFVALALVMAALPTLDNRWYSVVIVLALAPAQLFWGRLLPNGRMVAWRAVHDGLASVAVAMLSPQVWHPVMLVFAMGVGNLGRQQTPRSVQLLLASIGLTLAGIGAYQDRPAWLATSVTVVILLVLRRVVVDSMWERVQDAEGQLHDVLDSVSTALYIADPKTREVTWISPSIERITGRSNEQMLRIQSELPPEQRIDHHWIAEDDLVEGSEFNHYLRNRHHDGRWIWLAVNSRVGRDHHGNLSMRGHYSDATDLVDAQAQLEDRATRDQITGLGNRHVLLSTLSDYVENKTDCALLILDIDQFKEINDTLGHSFGDMVLREIGSRISAAAPNELVCRLGGDEFAIVVVEPANLDLIAHDIAVACAQVMRIEPVTLASRVSIGSAMFPDDGASSDDLLRRADIAMYQAKVRTEAYVRFDESMERNSLLHFELSAMVPDALAEGQFEAFFQPQLDLATEQIVGAEALVRWRHPVHGLLLPGAFLDFVKLSSVRRAFTDHMIDRAAHCIDNATNIGHPIAIAVNISVLSLFDEGFPDRVAAVLHQHGVAPHQLRLEITEDDIMEEHTSASPVLAALADMGIGLSIDDFGTGHSSLSRLVDLPISEIKIDTRFVGGAVDHRRERAIVESIIGLGQRLGIGVVAEGIETPAQAELLIGLGCPIGQGFLYSQAVEASQFIAALAAQSQDTRGLSSSSTARLSGHTRLGGSDPL